MLCFDILTLFPSVFDGVLGESILKRAVEAGLVRFRVFDIRDWSSDHKHGKVDDRPYGGGPGMVLMPGPVVESVEQLLGEGPARVFLTSPAGRRFDQAMARELAGEQRIIIVCGHYEGYDERIRDILAPEEVSIGDFVLTGGEIPAMVLVDAVTRLVPGVLGDPASNIEDSFTGELLDHPHYTRPEVYRELRVPEVLLSGDHARIAMWRLAGSEKRTAERRPDLFDAYQSRMAAARKQRKRKSKDVPGHSPDEAQRSEL